MVRYIAAILDYIAADILKVYTMYMYIVHVKCCSPSSTCTLYKMYVQCIYTCTCIYCTFTCIYMITKVCVTPDMVIHVHVIHYCTCTCIYMYRNSLCVYIHVRIMYTCTCIYMYIVHSSIVG